MSDQINEFDQIFRDKLNGQMATPPPAVWDNIQAHRSFGHVVANRISTNWRIFGTLLMLMLAGGSSIILFGEEENTIANYNTRQFQNIINTELQHNNDKADKKIEQVIPNAFEQQKILNVSSNFHKENVHHRYGKSEEASKMKKENIPSPDVLASVMQAGFIRPNLDNERLSAYIENLDGWESAKPRKFVRYYHLDKLEKQAYYKNDLVGEPKTALIDYDYVLPRVERKTFKERSSILISITPHIVHKSMSAEYNLSSSFLEDRKKAENTRLAYTFGAQLHYELKNHKFIETGLNFTQIYEEMSYEGKKRFSNQYNFFEVPFLMGYEDRTAKWGWNFKAGLGIQLFNSYHGYILKRMDDFGGVEEEKLFRSGGVVRTIIENDHTLSNNQARNEVVDLENKDENPYKTTGVVNLHIATGLVYYHSIKTSFIVTPSYKRSINSITKESALFNEKITYVGVSFGARMKF